MLPLPGKPPFDLKNPHPYWITAAKVYNGLFSLSRRNPFSISGLANADMESAFKPSAVGDKGTAFGLWQHHWVPRGAKILAGTGIDVRIETDPFTCCRALWWELNNTRSYSRALSLMLQTSTVSIACPIFTAQIEGAGAPDAGARRVQDALLLSRWVADNPVFLAQFPPPPRSP